MTELDHLRVAIRRIHDAVNPTPGSDTWSKLSGEREDRVKDALKSLGEAISVDSSSRIFPYVDEAAFNAKSESRNSREGFECDHCGATEEVGACRGFLVCDKCGHIWPQEQQLYQGITFVSHMARANDGPDSGEYVPLSGEAMRYKFVASRTNLWEADEGEGLHFFDTMKEAIKYAGEGGTWTIMPVLNNPD